MTAIHRREILGTLLSGAAIAAFGLALMPAPAESAPLGAGKGLNATTETLAEAVQWRRRRVCWWHRGRRVCRWR
jgi:hypothetical protein